MVEISSAWLSVRLTPATRELIERLAEQQNRTVSQMARILIQQGLVRHRKALGFDVFRHGWRKTALALPIGFALATALPGRSVIMPPLREPPKAIVMDCDHAGHCKPILVPFPRLKP